MANICKALLSLLVLMALSACGGGGDDGGEGGGGIAAPSALSYPTPQALVVGTSASFSPTVTGTVSSYTVSPVLPAGLTLNATSGAISGTPTTEVASAAYTVTATNSSGSVTFVVTIAVARKPTPPTGLTYPSPTTVFVGKNITPILPTVTNAVTSYAITPELPHGVTFNTTTGAIGGYTNQLVPESPYTVTATNDDGNTTFQLMFSTTLAPAELNFFQAYRRSTVSWEAVPGAQIYRLFTSSDAGETFTQLGGDMTELSYSQVTDFFSIDWDHRRYYLRACSGAVCSESAQLNIKPRQTDSITYVKDSNIGFGDAFGRSVWLGCFSRCMLVGIATEDSQDRGIFPGPFGGTDDLAQDSGAVLFRHIDSGAGPVSLTEYFFKSPNSDVGDRYGTKVAVSDLGNTIAISAPFEDGSASTINGDGSSNAAPQSGAVYVYGRQQNGTYTLQAYIKPSNTGVEDHFGSDLAISGDGFTIIVGAPQESSNATTVNGDGANNSAFVSGAAYVFKQDINGIWTQAAYLKAPNAEAGDRFGTSVAVDWSGQTFVVGAPGEQSNSALTPANNSLTNAGAAYVFSTNSSGVITPGYYLKAFNAGLQDQFGHSVAINRRGDIVAVGAPGEDSGTATIGMAEFSADQPPATDDAAENAGAVYLFKKGGFSSYVGSDYVKAPVRHPNMQFGEVLSFGDWDLAVGATEESSGASGIDGDSTSTSAPRSGAVFRYHSIGLFGYANPREPTYIKAPNPDAGDQFGASVSMGFDDDAMLIGSPGESSSLLTDPDDDFTLGAGAVYLY